jgi:L-aminopeptidase/D-esterase-like protein
LSVGDVLFAVAEAGLTLKAGMAEDTLKAYPATRLTPELATAIKEHKAAIIQVLREEEEMRRTGIIQSERQVFEMAREYFGLDSTENVS